MTESSSLCIEMSAALFIILAEYAAACSNKSLTLGAHRGHQRIINVLPDVPSQQSDSRADTSPDRGPIPIERTVGRWSWAHTPAVSAQLPTCNTVNPSAPPFPQSMASIESLEVHPPSPGAIILCYVGGKWGFMQEMSPDTH